MIENSDSTEEAIKTCRFLKFVSMTSSKTYIYHQKYLLWVPIIFYLPNLVIFYIISFQTDLYLVHASCLFDYQTTVEDTIMCNIGLYLDVYEQMLREKGQFEMQDSDHFLEIVEKKYPKSEKPWLFLMSAASVLLKEKDFSPIEAEVSEIHI